MEQYYSSDEEVAWGPLTLQEVQKELEKPPRKIARRETESGQSTFYSCPSESETRTEVDLPTPDQTPDNSIQPFKGEDYDTFFGRLNKAVDDLRNRKPTGPKLYVPPAETTNDSILKILDSEKCENLENIEQTLVDNTIYVSSDDESDSGLNVSSGVIVISDTEEDLADLVKKERRTLLPLFVNKLFSDDQTDESPNDETDAESPNDDAVEPQELEDSDEYAFKLTEELKELDKIIVSADFSSSNDSSSTEDSLVINDSQEDMKVASQGLEDSGENAFKLTEGSKELDKIIVSADCSSSNDSSSTEDSLVFNDSQEDMEIAAQDLEDSGESAFKLTESSKEQNENIVSEVCSLSNASTSNQGEEEDSLAFNDTIEEMEMALKRGLDYVMPDDEPPVSTQMEIDSPFPIHIPSTPKTEAIKKPQKTKKFDYVQSPIGDYIRRKSPVHDNFKLPLKPTKNKQTPCKAQSKYFKNIVSPVGVYIKNSPGVCLKQNVPVRTISKVNVEAQVLEPKCNKENAGIPQVVYKPAKTVIAATKRDIILPPSIQKLVQEPIVTQHDKRIKSKCEASMIRKLLEEDLTATTLPDASLLNETADVSFVTNKQAFIK